jgi:hypothetical protein
VEIKKVHILFLIPLLMMIKEVHAIFLILQTIIFFSFLRLFVCLLHLILVYRLLINPWGVHLLHHHRPRQYQIYPFFLIMIFNQVMLIFLFFLFHLFFLSFLLMSIIYHLNLFLILYKFILFFH